jgi:hypothetical protein
MLRSGFFFSLRDPDAPPNASKPFAEEEDEKGSRRDVENAKSPAEVVREANGLLSLLAKGSKESPTRKPSSSMAVVALDFFGLDLRVGAELRPAFSDSHSFRALNSL